MKDFEAALELTLRTFLRERRAEAAAIDARLGALGDELGAAGSAGGKRLRPLLAAWGYRGGGAGVGGALGQVLDLLAGHSRRVTEEQALTVDRYKTASYTVQRPIQLGLALAGAGDELVAAVSAYAVPAGIAFQLRDDVLGAFGDPDLTGK